MAWVRNTSAYPDEEVRELIEFATKGVNMAKVCVNVKGCRGRRRGRAYPYIPSISNAPPTADYLITLGLGTDIGPSGLRNYYWETPEEANPNGRFPFYETRCWRETLVALAAHEARHVHQFRHGKSLSEVDCERFAAKALERYRVRCAELEEAA